MSLKTIKMKRDIAKMTTSPVETFAVKQLFAQLEALVKESHDDVSAEKRKEMVALATSLYAQLQELTTKLQKTTENDILTAKKDLEKQKVTLVAEIKRISNELTDTLDQYKTEVLAKVENKVQRILSNTEAFRGPQGLPGEPGKPGQNGSPDTPDQVVEKVNTAKGVKISAIDGLEDELKKVKKATGGKIGGGMGNPQHETHAVNSSSTVVTLTYSPAAQGRAIWAYYQGQHLVYGTDFTVNERSVALLFTPVDSTFIDITYIRG